MFDFIGFKEGAPPDAEVRIENGEAAIGACPAEVAIAVGVLNAALMTS
jgi:uncharacterized membrane protein YjfL (UPF0719 family)